MLKPKIRFEDYHLPWSSKLLSDYLYENKDRNKAGAFSKEDVLSVSGEKGIVNQIELQGRSFAGKSVVPYHIVYTGDLVYTKSPLKANPYGIIKCNMGVPGIVSTLYAVYRCKDNVDGRFVELYFASDYRLNKYLKPLVHIGAKHDMKINNEKVLSDIVNFPSLDEQRRIVSFFSDIDEVISKSEAEVAALEKQKKGVIQKIFSQEVRFMRDDGSKYPDWEEKKLGDIADYKKGPFGSALKKEKFVPKSDNTVKVYEQQNAINKDWKFERYYITQDYYEAKLKSFAVHAGDIIISCAGTIGEIYELPFDADSGVINQALMRVRIKKSLVNSLIFYCVFDEVISKKGQKLSNGSALKNIPPFADLKSQSIWLPCLEEQQKIASFLSDLDAAINLAKQELEKWKLLKKGLMQQMFV